jgi:hypothetical protein
MTDETLIIPVFQAIIFVLVGGVVLFVLAPKCAFEIPGRTRRSTE